MALLIPHNLLAPTAVKEAGDADWFEGDLVKMSTLREFVEGWVELVRFQKPITYGGHEYHYLICNEEGKLLNLPINVSATGFMIADQRRDLIVGNAVLLKKEEIN